MKAFKEAKTKGVTVTDEEVQAQFDKLKEQGITDDFDVQHILIKAQKGDAAAKTKIDAIHERLKKGEDFSAVAKEVTEDTGSKKNGGEYKGVRRGQMVPEFDKKMAEAKVGEISEPFMSQFGWHILKVNRHGTGTLTPEISERMKQKIADTKTKAELNKLVQEKRNTLSITINLPANPNPTAPEVPGAEAPKGALDSVLEQAS
jgi:parvulin-like peptidyl-prolyl isomerase